MQQSSIRIEKLDTGMYRVCTPQQGLCVETWDEVRAQAVAAALHCSSHSEMRASRASVQNSRD
jgi:hypothetical protein